MKNILSILTALTLSASAATPVISCGVQDNINKQAINAIKNTIGKLNISIPARTNPDTSNPDTIITLKKHLVRHAPYTKENIDNIIFSKTTLKPGVTVPVDTLITIGTHLIKVPLQIKLEETIKASTIGKSTHFEKAKTIGKSTHFEKAKIITDSIKSSKAKTIGKSTHFEKAIKVDPKSHPIEWIDAIKVNVYETAYFLTFGTHTHGDYILRFHITKDNILWANDKGWSHFFDRLYTHIGIYHPEVGYSAGKTTVVLPHLLPLGNSYTGYIFDKNALSTGCDVTYGYSVFASYFWAWSSNKYDFMGDTDLDSHNGSNGGMHGTYVDTLVKIAKDTPKDKIGISFQMTYNCDSDARSRQILDTSTIAYY